MNREEFINYMHNPELLDKKSVTEMRELLYEFPYFQTVHLLFLKNLHSLDNIKFPSQLKISAAHIADREVLYHLLHKKAVEPEIEELPKEKAEKKTEAPEKPEAEIKEKKEAEVTPKEEPEKPEPVEPKKEKTKAEVPPVAAPDSSKKPVSEKVTESEKVTAKPTPEEPPTHTRDELADQIKKRLEELRKGKTAAPADRIPGKADKPGDKKSIADAILEQLSQRKDKKSGEPEDRTAPADDKATGKKKTERPPPGEIESSRESESNPASRNEDGVHDSILLIDEEEEIIREELSKESTGDESSTPASEKDTGPISPSGQPGDLLDFEYSERAGLSGKIKESEDQKSISSDEPEQSISEKKTTIEKTVSDDPIGERFSFTIWLDLLQHPEIKHTSASEDTRDVDQYSNSQLIDKFLESDPKIISPDEPEEEQEDISLRSVEDDEGFITDTLAKIYIKQGYYSKAIFAYEKLSLKFPEKSSYFASQIQKIKELIKNL